MSHRWDLHLAKRETRPGSVPLPLTRPRPGATVHDVRRACRPELVRLTDLLIAEYANRLSPGAVIMCVAQARESLLRTGVRAGLPVAVASMARTRLSTEAPPPSAAP
jgi:hypothetical protein